MARTRPALVAMLVLAATCGCSKSQRGEAKILSAAVEATATSSVAVLRVSFLKTPPGDPAEMSVGLGSIALEGSGFFPWEKLAELDDNPETTPERPPRPGLDLTFRIPLQLKPAFKTNPGNDVILNAGLYWGNQGDIPLEQDRRTISLEDLYKKDYGLKPLAPDRQAAAEAEHERPGAPP